MSGETYGSIRQDALVRYQVRSAEICSVADALQGHGELCERLRGVIRAIRSQQTQTNVHRQGRHTYKSYTQGLVALSPRAVVRNFTCDASCSAICSKRPRTQGAKPAFSNASASYLARPPE